MVANSEIIIKNNGIMRGFFAGIMVNINTANKATLMVINDMPAEPVALSLYPTKANTAALL